MSSSRSEVQRTRVGRDAARDAQRIRRALGDELRRLRQDSGLSLSELARAALVSKAHLSDIENARREASLTILCRTSSVLGASLGVRLFAGTGPLMRDHIQVAMISALLRELHPRWQATPEVAVHQPVRGVIDLVMDSAHATDRASSPLVACEAQSELRRLEQQLRWAKAKAEALGEARQRSVSRLLLLRLTRATRQLAAEHAELLSISWPARCADVYSALTQGTDWPGDGLLWCRVEASAATILRHPPRGIRVGR